MGERREGAGGKEKVAGRKERGGGRMENVKCCKMIEFW